MNLSRKEISKILAVPKSVAYDYVIGSYAYTALGNYSWPPLRCLHLSNPFRRCGGTSLQPKEVLLC
jgi:hypothetical protein